MPASRTLRASGRRPSEIDYAANGRSEIKDPIREVTDAWRDAQRHDAEFNRLSERCKDFNYKQIHWDNDPGRTLDHRLQPKGVELIDLRRYKNARILYGGPNIDCRPRDRFTDPQAAGYAKLLLQSVLEDNTNRYLKFRRQIVDGSQGVGTWYGEAHWDPNRGPWGNVVFQSKDPRFVFPCPGWLDLHDPLCPYVIIEDHITVPVIEARGGKEKWHWKNTDNLWPDNHGRYSSQEHYTKAAGEPTTDDEYTPGTVTVLRCYYRTSDETYEEHSGERDLAPDQQYMGCYRCGFKDQNHERMPDGSLPDVGMPCPRCLNGPNPFPSYLLKITREEVTERRLSYPQGRLVIIAPFQQRLFYDGPWQAPTRSFPLFQLRAYEVPYEQRGACDTLYYWSLQTLMDALRRQMYEQVVTSKPLIIMAGGPDGQGLIDQKGEPFVFDDTSGQIAYAKVPSLQGMVEHFQGPGPPTSFAMLYNIISGSFFQTKGTGQVNFSPERSRDVAYSSLRLQQESGDTAVDDHKEILFEEEGLFWGNVLDIILWNAPYAYFERLFGPETDNALRLLRAEPGANVDVVVGSPPAIKQGAIDELEALQKWDLLQNPALRRIAARKLGISPADEAEVEADRERQMQLMQQRNGQSGASIPAGTGGANPSANIGATS